LNKTVQEYFKNGRRKVISVVPTDNYLLKLEFDNGEKRVFDMKDKLTGVFEVLKDKKKFNSVFINNTGDVSWDIDKSINSNENRNNRIEICKDALYLNSNLPS
jgi:hypothetical protein